GRTTSWTEGWRLIGYATLGLTTLLGPLSRIPRFGPWLIPVLPVASATLFFLTSNFAVWTEGLMYPMTFSGLVECYAAGIPYYLRGTLPADFIGTAVLFGLGPVVEKWLKRITLARPLESSAVESTPQA